MSNKEFNKHLSEYLSAKRKKEGGNKKRSLFRKKKRKAAGRVEREFPEITGDDIQIVEEKKPFLQWLADLFGVKKSQKAPIEEEDKDLSEEEVFEEVEDQIDFASEEHEIEDEIEKSPSIWETIKSWFKSEKDPGEIEEIADELTDKEDELKSEFEEIERKEEEIKVELQELELRRKNATDRLIRLFDDKKLKVADAGRVVAMDEYNSLEDDLVEVSKFSIDLIKTLPKRKRELLVESERFRKFKHILRERRIIKDSSSE